MIEVLSQLASWRGIDAALQVISATMVRNPLRLASEVFSNHNPPWLAFGGYGVVHLEQGSTTHLLGKMFYSDHDQVRLATKSAHQLKRYFDTCDNSVKVLSLFHVMIVNARHLVCRALGVGAIALSGELDAERIYDNEPAGGDPRGSL
eukprot:2020097-Amphidinium_carterae.1